MRYAVILGGGLGTRLWPASRPDRPKQFLRLFSDRSLLQETYDRLLPALDAALSEGRHPVCVVLPENQLALAREHLPDLPKENFIVEPCPRGTAAAVGFSAASLQQRDSDAVLAAVPAECFVPDADLARFAQTLQGAMDEAEASDAILLVGIRPTRIETGYGYIEIGQWGAMQNEQAPERPVSAPADLFVLPVVGFVEKPPADEARRMVESGRFLWNSGIFVAKAHVILDRLSEFLPGHHEAVCMASHPSSLIPRYSTLDPISFDHGVLEPSSRMRGPDGQPWAVAVVPGDFRWSDVGNWAAVYEVARSIGAGQENVIGGDPAQWRAIDTTNCLLYTTGSSAPPRPRVTLLGAQNLAVVVDESEILICPLDRAQDVRDLADE